jgi:hypothetical protein
MDGMQTLAAAQALRDLLGWQEHAIRAATAQAGIHAGAN